MIQSFALRSFAVNAALILATLILIATGCGGNATQKTPDPVPAAESSAPESGLPADPGATIDLIGSEWLLEDIAGDDVLNNVQVTLAFPGPGRVAGVGSCNGFDGSCTLGDIAVAGGIGGARFAVGPLNTTRKACVPAVGEQEQRYLAALQAAERIEIEGRTLRVYMKGTAKPLRFARISP